MGSITCGERVFSPNPDYWTPGYFPFEISFGKHFGIEIGGGKGISM